MRGSPPPPPAAAPSPAAAAPLAFLPRKGRGAVSNLAHRFASVAREPDGDARDADRRAAAEEGAGEGDDAPPPLPTTVAHERARTILVRNDSPDIPFELSLNPYRGCEHGCIYCYARPTHSYLNLSPGLDFETRLVAKVNAAERLRAALAAPGYRPAPLSIGSATDAYQPIERGLRITRAVVELLVAARHPFSVVTKSSLVERDLDLLRAAAADDLTAVAVSLTTLDHALARKLEPRAASPARRLRTIAVLAAAGVPVHVNVAPVIPFVTEPELERILQAARDAGARTAHCTALRLPWEVAPLFREWLAAHYPQRAQRVMNRVREMHGGKDYDARFGLRMTGEGAWAELLHQRFRKARARLGLDRPGVPLRTDLFVPPRPATAQLELF